MASHVNMPRTSIAGYADYTLPQHIEFNKWKVKVAEAFDLYGFVRFDSKKVERATDLTKKGGMERDMFAVGHYREGKIVAQKSVLCLPFDRTVPLALFVSKNPSIQLPLKRQDIDYSWRFDEPGPGRFRAFIQADVDIIDKSLNIFAESECINAILQALDGIGVNDYTLYLNHIGIAKSLIDTLKLSDEDKNAKALRIVDSLDKIDMADACKQIADLNPGATAIQIRELLNIFKFKGSVKDFQDQYPLLPITDDLIKQVGNLSEILIDKGVPSQVIAFCPGMVRGLDYYTGIVFETYLNKAPHRGSIASGGRYDNLVAAVSENSRLNKIQGFGGSIGLTRLFDVCLREGMVDPQKCTAAKVLICCENIEDKQAFALQKCAAELANRVRKLEIAADLYTNPKSDLTAQLRYAKINGFAHAIIVQAEAEKKYLIKDMINRDQMITESIDRAENILTDNIAKQESCNERAEYALSLQ